MKAQIDSISPTRSVVSVSVSAEEFAATKATVAKEYAGSVSLPGFRPGKAPVALVERNFKSRIFADAFDRALRDAFEKAVKDNSLDVYEFIASDSDNSAETDGAAAKFTVDLVPKFDLPALDAIPVDDADTKVSDDDVAARVESFRKLNATYEPLENGAALAADDAAHLDYAGTVDGKPLAEAIPEGSAFSAKQNVYCVAGSEYFIIPGIAARLVGKKVGDEFEATVEFPADFYIEAMRGVKVDYKIRIASGSALKMPEPDEGFFKKLGVKDMDDLKARLRASMEEQAKAADRSRRINQIAAYLSKAVSFDVPQGALERMTESVLSGLLRANMDKGVAKEDLSKERERLTAAAREQAASRLRTDFILDKIAEERKISLEDGEFNTYLTFVAQNAGMDASQMRALAKDRQAIRGHYRAAVREKVLAKLLETATPTAGVGGR